MLDADAALAVVSLLAVAAVAGVLVAGLAAETLSAWLARDTGSRTSRRPQADPERALDETALPEDPRED